MGAIVVVAAGTAGGIWLATGQQSAHPGPAASTPGPGSLAGASHQASQSTAGPASPLSSPSVTVPASPTASASPTAYPSPTAAATGTVTVSAAAAASPQSQPITGVLNNYFSAINSRDYREYRSLLVPRSRRALTRQKFASGYRSTVDSRERLISIFPAADGDTVAAIEFTSHQDPADSPNGRACIRWHISIYLQPAGSRYLIDRPPAGYHAALSRCQ